MNFLVTNDDGITGPGLWAAVRSLRTLFGHGRRGDDGAHSWAACDRGFPGCRGQRHSALGDGRLGRAANGQQLAVGVQVRCASAQPERAQPAGRRTGRHPDHQAQHERVSDQLSHCSMCRKPKDYFRVDAFAFAFGSS